jgi:hypothetical protein
MDDNAWSQHRIDYSKFDEKISAIFSALSLSPVKPVRTTISVHVLLVYSNIFEFFFAFIFFELFRYLSGMR